MDSPYLIIITGHSCTGKSTLTKTLLSNLHGWYHIGFDSIKWNLSGYNREKDIDTIRDILDGFSGVLLEKGISCISDRFFREAQEYKKLHTLAESHGYTIISILLETPEGIRLERFGERVQKAKSEGSTNISVMDEAIFRENMRKSFYFPEDAMRFDTSLLEAEDIAKIIISKIQKK